jgi:uncharacterized protein YraI
MERVELIDAFNDCVDRLNAGQSLDACLRAYPQFAAELRDLLVTVQTVHAARPAVPAGARDRVRARVMAGVTPARARSRPVWRARSRLALAAAAIAVIIAASLILRAERKPNTGLHVHPIATMTATASATASATLTSSPSRTPTRTPTATPTASPSRTPTRTPTATPSPTPTPSATVTPAPDCTFTVTADSANLRAGPGTGYASMGYALRGEVFPVVGLHTSGAWLIVRTANGDAWIADAVGEISGDCTGLPLIDEPMRNATVTPQAAGPGEAAPTTPVGPPTDDHGGHGADDGPDPTDDHGGGGDD